MYDLNKIIVLKYDNDPEVVVMKTIGMKITDILYINKQGYLTDDNYIDMEESIKSELYDDMYDDDLNIILKESLDDNDYIDIASFIDDIWDKDSIVYTYGFDNDGLKDEIKNYNGKIFIDDYYSMFVSGKDIEKPIETIMTEQGLNIGNMLKDSKLSFIYFLHALVEKLLSK